MTSPLMNNYGPAPITLVKGKGTEVWDDDGRRYLDFLSGIAVVNLGHSNPVVADAIAKQARTLVHTSNLYYTQPQMELAPKLDALIRDGRGEPGKILFQNSGAEANEGALKLARKFAGRGRAGVLSAFRSFHGRTLMTLAATGQPEKHEPFQPLPEGFRHAQWNDLGEFDRALDDTIGTVILEPLQGEGGVIPGDAVFFEGIRRMCDERGIVLIFDEVQTGMARTGKWFGFQHFDVMPDIVTMAKGLGNGMPIGAVWARTEVADAFGPGDHGCTFGGQPLACSAANAVIDEMQRLDAPAMAATKGAYFADAVSGLPGVSSTRGLGLLMGIELDPDVLNGRTGADVTAACRDAGLLLIQASPTSLRVAPPLTTTEAEIDEAVAILSGVLS
jgi:acetylornithine/N-succinyldiaminopimelate aminotransferase